MVCEKGRGVCLSGLVNQSIKDTTQIIITVARVTMSGGWLLSPDLPYFAASLVLTAIL